MSSIPFMAPQGVAPLFRPMNSRYKSCMPQSNFPQPISTGLGKTADMITAYTPLVLSLFYFVGINFSERSAAELLLLVGIYLIHIALYHAIAYGNALTQNICIGATMLLCLAASPLNPSSYTFYWYMVYFAAFLKTPRIALLISAIATSFIIAAAQWNNYWVYWYFLPALVPCIAMFGHGFYERKSLEFAEAQRQSQQELEQLAKVAERERIARDLHDVMGHNLATIALKAQLAEKQGRAGKIEDAMNEISEVSRITSQTLSEMRSVISGYRFRSIEAHIDKLVHSLEDASFSVDMQLNLPEMPAKSESTLALILTEAVTNILKHSQGKRAWLLSEGEDGNLSIRIGDDGKLEGFTEGNGMQGMRERISELNGSIHYDLSRGTEICIDIPAKNTEQSYDQNIIG